MRNLAILILLVLQSFAYAGPVCGTHLSAAESMACCEKAHHNTDKQSLSDSDANACCASCDTGKIQAVKRQDHSLLQHAAISFVVAPVVSEITVYELAVLKWSPQKFDSLDPPEILLLEQSFRI